MTQIQLKPNTDQGPGVGDAVVKGQRQDADIVGVHVDRLDSLMNLVGELALIRNQVLQSLDAGGDPAFLGISQRLDLLNVKNVSTAAAETHVGANQVLDAAKSLTELAVKLEQLIKKIEV